MKLSKKLILGASILMASQSQALAAGYSTSLYSTSGLGTSYAGSAAGSHDVSDMFFNPAIISDIKTKQFIASVSYLDLKINPSNATGTGGATGNNDKDAGKNAFVPAFYLSTPLNKETTFGLAVTSPFGLSTSYNPNWAGKTNAIDSSIRTTNINPTLSYKVTDKLAVAAGVQAQYMEATMTQDATGSGNMAKTRASDWGYGYNLGLHYKISDEAKVGMGYRSKIAHKLEGNTSVAGLGLASNTGASLSTPESLTIGGSYKLNKKLELLSDITWTRWSRFKNLTVSQLNNTFAASTTHFNFQDSFMYSVGANYTVDDKLLLRAGTAYEQGGVRDSAREARVPSSDRVWASIGANYKLTKSFSLDVAYMHQFYRAGQANLSNLHAKYKASVDVLSLGIKKDF